MCPKSLGVEPLDGIMDIVPYKGGESKIAGKDKVYKLSSNENPLGFSMSAKQAYLDTVTKLYAYPDGSHDGLRAAIAERYGIDKDRIVCGNGSDELFQILGRAFLRVGDEIVQSEYGFLVYRLVAQQAGAKCISAKTKDYTSQVDAILACVTDKTRIVFLDNPNNPTGTYIPFEEIKRLQANLPPSVLLVLDGAYSEYVNANDYSSGIELAGSCENVLITRTFSKIYGLAALRIGWCYGSSHIIDILNRVRSPFNLNIPALNAGTAAMKDVEFVDKSNSHNALWLEKITSELKALGFNTLPSVANFFLLILESTEKADELDAFLKTYGLIVRKVAAYGLSNCLRISIGTIDANNLLIQAFKDFRNKNV